MVLIKSVIGQSKQLKTKLQWQSFLRIHLYLRVPENKTLPLDVLKTSLSLHAAKLKNKQELFLTCRPQQHLPDMKEAVALAAWNSILQWLTGLCLRFIKWVATPPTPKGNTSTSATGIKRLTAYCSLIKDRASKFSLEYLRIALSLLIQISSTQTSYCGCCEFHTKLLKCWVQAIHHKEKYLISDLFQLSLPWLTPLSMINL